MSEFTFNLDHVVVVVPDLERAMEQYRGLGFTVGLGGTNGPTHNALIAFKDQTYIELISIRSSLMSGILYFLYRTKLLYLLRPIMSPLSFRFMCWLGGQSGMRDWCIKVARLENIVDCLSANNTRMSGLEKFTRTKPNLEIVEWLLAAPGEQRLPFFIQDITDTGIRIPSGDATSHSNGCIGISRLLLNRRIYSSMMESIAVLNHQATGTENYSSQTEVQLVDDLDGHIAIELVGLESKHKVLHMKHKQAPKLG
ncbi:MAG: hypothetical protein ACI9XU_000487 [Arenicella sp.]|jgi:hypothetical protein